MDKYKIKKLDDKDLQLRYFLGGLRYIPDGKENMCNYWVCNISCSCDAVPDDKRLDAVKNFINNHNITNERFLKLAYNYLIGATMKYHGKYSKLFLELEEVIKPYGFIQTKLAEIQDNTFSEKELEKIVINTYDSNSIIGDFIKIYNLTIEDFIILAKTILNHNLHGLFVSNPNDTFISEIKEIINSYGLTTSKEYIEEYKSKQEMDELIIELKSIQKKYLKLMKELLIKDSDLVIKIINEELNELGFNNKKDIKKLIKKDNQKLF